MYLNPIYYRVSGYVASVVSDISALQVPHQISMLKQISTFIQLSTFIQVSMFTVSHRIFKYLILK